MRKSSKDLRHLWQIFLESLREKSVSTNTNNTEIIPVVTKIYNKNTNVYSYIISDLDVLFYIIVPFFSNIKFKTRKYTDFYLWTIAIKLRIYGFNLIPEGKDLLLKISNSTNKSRYNNNLEIPSKSEIDRFFLNRKPLLDINTNSHTTLVQDFFRKKGSRYGFEVFVYKDNKFVGHYPSYNKAQKALSIKGNKTIARLIDTGRISKIYGYKFYSNQL